MLRPIPRPDPPGHRTAPGRGRTPGGGGRGFDGGGPRPVGLGGRGVSGADRRGGSLPPLHRRHQLDPDPVRGAPDAPRGESRTVQTGEGRTAVAQGDRSVALGPPTTETLLGPPRP
ncbi:MAG TPA: hypothetical protein EYP52_09170 [Anaerolineae bacterium]|nr:hypothetical protein [Anaerolineae bacterium]